MKMAKFAPDKTWHSGRAARDMGLRAEDHVQKWWADDTAAKKKIAAEITNLHQAFRDQTLSSHSLPPGGNISTG
jgi:hypothetical protein